MKNKKKLPLQTGSRLLYGLEKAVCSQCLPVYSMFHCLKTQDRDNSGRELKLRQKAHYLYEIWKICGNFKSHIKINLETSTEHFSISCSTLCKTVGGKWSANKLVFGLLGLTGTGSGGAFPETVLEGNFSQVLSHFLSLFCINSKMRKSVQSNKSERCMTDADIFFFKNQTVKPQAYLWGVHGGEVSLCPMEFPHTCYRCSLELH